MFGSRTSRFNKTNPFNSSREIGRGSRIKPVKNTYKKPHPENSEWGFQKDFLDLVRS